MRIIKMQVKEDMQLVGVTQEDVIDILKIRYIWIEWSSIRLLLLDVRFGLFVFYSNLV